MNNKGSRRGYGESKQLLAEEVFHHIATQIIDGDLAPGHRIRDVDVAEELHVSRTPVREALQRLERLGLVTMYPSRFTEVTEVTPEIVEQTLEFAGYQAGAAARMAVMRMTDAQRAHAATLVEGMYDALDDSVAISNSRWAVFSYLSDHSQNAQHRVLVQDAGIALFRNLRSWTIPHDDRERMTQLYRDFREAVLRGDGDDAERLTRAMHYV
ncbi:GntR family transcriptional regulator [Streptomyces sp. AC495_CC817]|uniref:GntR family transcriptional regulator n=1 Tax=Streptomyces sp. AC495_CC817 TaxID=2823900 RepID=UPI001C2570C5|nr:GntR family transcriptional regulator [Streptomyces sp. AC495_CC817]